MRFEVWTKVDVIDVLPADMTKLWTNESVWCESWSGLRVPGGRVVDRLGCEGFPKRIRATRMSWRKSLERAMEKTRRSETNDVAMSAPWIDTTPFCASERAPCVSQFCLKKEKAMAALACKTAQ